MNKLISSATALLVILLASGAHAEEACQGRVSQEVLNALKSCIEQTTNSNADDVVSCFTTGYKGESLAPGPTTFANALTSAMSIYLGGSERSDEGLCNSVADVAQFFDITATCENQPAKMLDESFKTCAYQVEKGGNRAINLLNCVHADTNTFMRPKNGGLAEFMQATVPFVIRNERASQDEIAGSCDLVQQLLPRHDFNPVKEHGKGEGNVTDDTCPDTMADRISSVDKCYLEIENATEGGRILKMRDCLLENKAVSIDQQNEGLMILLRKVVTVYISKRDETGKGNACKLLLGKVDPPRKG